MTIPFEKLKARLLANPKVKVEYDGARPGVRDFGGVGEGSLAGGVVPSRTGCAHGHQPVCNCPTGERSDTASTKTLLRYAEATGSRFHVRLSAA